VELGLGMNAQITPLEKVIVEHPGEMLAVKTVPPPLEKFKASVNAPVYLPVAVHAKGVFTAKSAPSEL